MKQKIIVIDDSQTVRTLLSTVLVAAGYEIIEAEDGFQGMNAIAAHPTASLAICDVNMPRLSGIDMLELLARQASNVVPVLMLTTDGRPELIERSRASGAKGWMVKPFKLTMLLATVKKLARPLA